MGGNGSRRKVMEHGKVSIQCSALLEPAWRDLLRGTRVPSGPRKM